MQSDPEHFFKVMYGNTPNIWSGEISRDEKMRFSVNALTRMRCLNKDQSLDFKYNGSLNNLPAHLKPWFSFKSIFKRDKRIISGHWSAIELHHHPYGSSIDSACIWGKKLTALRLEDNKTFSVAANNKDLN
jgi:bis(5'-nucleosyl)-tetraphosphatase (symmetrical)